GRTPERRTSRELVGNTRPFCSRDHIRRRYSKPHRCACQALGLLIVRRGRLAVAAVREQPERVLVDRRADGPHAAVGEREHADADVRPTERHELIGRGPRKWEPGAGASRRAVDLVAVVKIAIVWRLAEQTDRDVLLTDEQRVTRAVHE